jgi:hypothetical protein
MRRNISSGDLCFFVRVYVKLAMETFAQIEKGHAVDMKKVSTAGAYTNG